MLDQIITEKKKELVKIKAVLSLQELTKKASSFIGQQKKFKQAISQPGKINLIAEIKKASASKGILRTSFEPVKIARTYASAGARALSILTETKFFQGDLAYLRAVREAVDLPILRKDFIIDQYQIYESACAGADAILLIAQLLPEGQLAEFSRLCLRLNLQAVGEVHNEEDLDKVLRQDIGIIGINHRDLRTFAEDLNLSAALVKKIPQDKIVIAESAIKTYEDVQYLQGLGVNAVLIGEAFMRSEDIGAKVKELMGN